jgi:hypothetical protein
MLTPMLLAVQALALAAGGQLDVAASARPEVRSRGVQLPQAAPSGQAPGGQTPVTPASSVSQLESWLVGTLQARYQDGPWQVQGQYVPALVLRDVLGASTQPESTHTGTLRLALLPDSRTTLFLLGNVGYGFYRFGPLDLVLGAPGSGSVSGGSGGPTGNPTTALDPTRSVEFLNLEARGGASWQLTRRLRLAAAAGWLEAGGVKAVDQRGLPLQRGPFAEGQLAWSASRRDALSVDVGLRATGFSGGTTGVERVDLATVSGQWVHQLAEPTTLTLLAGGGAGVTALAASPTEEARSLPNGYGMAAVSVGHQLLFEHQTLQLDAGVRAAPVVDPATALLQQRVEGQAAVRWTPRAGLTAGVRATAMTTVFSAAASRQRLVYTAADLTWALPPLMSLDATAAHAWDVLGAGPSPRRTWQAGVGLTVRLARGL